MVVLWSAVGPLLSPQNNQTLLLPKQQVTEGKGQTTSMKNHLYLPVKYAVWYSKDSFEPS